VPNNYFDARIAKGYDAKWADPAAADVLLIFVVREARETFRH
jgi:hypothetical protein